MNTKGQGSTSFVFNYIVTQEKMRINWYKVCQYVVYVVFNAYLSHNSIFGN